MAIHLVLLVSLTVVIPRTVQSVCVNSVGRCCNIRDQLETCGPMQFCSTSSLDKGCRNCSEISQHWCDKDPEQFLQQYPNCAILCTRKKVEELKLKVAALTKQLRSRGSDCNRTLAQKDEDLQKLQADRDEISEENSKLTRIISGVASVAALEFFVLVIFGCCSWKQLRAACSCLTASRRGQPEEDILLQSDQPGESQVPAQRQTIVAQEADRDSGRVSPSSTNDTSSYSSGSDNNLHGMRLPTGGTAHHVQDTQDFVRYLPHDETAAEATTAEATSALV